MAGPRLALLALVAVLAAALAGCSGKDPETPTPGGPDGPAGEGAGASASVSAPTWAIGDAWTYDFDGAATTYVITSETATDWMMETDSEERAFGDLRDDVSRLGPQRKSDLAGSQGGDRVAFFRWPLEANKTWTTRWDQQEVRVTVLEVADGKASLEARQAGGAQEVVYLYKYDSTARWFSELQRFDAGESLLLIRLTQAVHNWTGTIVHWTLDEVIADEGRDGATVTGPFDVPVGATDLWTDYHFTCTGAGGYFVALEPTNAGLAAQQGMQDGGPCAQVDWRGPTVTSPAAGQWLFTIDVGGQTADYDFTILVRTRVDVPFP
ncbi:MAG: hypothetical protein ACYC2H_02635 [Thermoplasmatota archaeon]